MSRGDFLRDAKYTQYLPYCHEFCFVVPQGLIDRTEVDESIGLMYYNPKTRNITTRRRAVYRDIEPNPEMLLYIIMNRLDSERAPFMLNRGEACQAYVDGKKDCRDLAWKVKSKLISENIDLNEKLKRAERCMEDAEELKAIRGVMQKFGIHGWRGELAQQLESALKSKRIPGFAEIEAISSQLARAVHEIKRAGVEGGETDDQDPAL